MYMIYVSKVWINSVLKLFRPRISWRIFPFRYIILSIQKKNTGQDREKLNLKYNISHYKNSHIRLANKYGSFYFFKKRLPINSWNRHHNNICLWLSYSKKNSYTSLSLTTRQSFITLSFSSACSHGFFLSFFVLKLVFVPQISYFFSC